MPEEGIQIEELRLAELETKSGVAQQEHGIVQGEKLRLTELVSKSGVASELPVQDRIRLMLANRVLLAIFVIIILSGLVLVYAPDTRIKEANTIFEFVKTIAPPLVTLVIGFYFQKDSTS